ncbi:hypothetical protein TPHA_0M00400 [Tetrapisispora phaffii CBS 4417]|uniref:U1-type domain-containing protein n=1 Tax=Tetrapisispora phaffii (strain ATCC 24235 / CBS 4417 / NBRC 1672 / NRRL Y-8282 / UCD 70-5) TaxID=1071381 RepID=G8C0V4_TETPH|nr:hypothetical protein TPHA_0M00400 [Tetrapisispora phaffii CBS 4417]CCE65615.1 hypothetical protein TPHA_0M00400 [Tetrapisispora phaffii CBS 4417]
MDYQNRAGSKKGAGGIASESHSNLQRRKKVEELLREGEQVPYTFQDEGISNNNVASNSLARKDPYIYKNHSGKLVCKLCNTMHMSWTSVERHLKGKKHGLSVLRRENMVDKHKSNMNKSNRNGEDLMLQQFQKAVEKRRQAIISNGIEPLCKISKIKDEESGLPGISIQVDYNTRGETNGSDLKVGKDLEYLKPFIKIVNGIELAKDSGTENNDKNNKKNDNGINNNATTVTKDEDINDEYLVIAYEPFENIGITLPPKEIILDASSGDELKSLEELNQRCTYWDSDSKYFYVQFFFK